jgi:putative heme-binding domain-containing protein
MPGRLYVAESDGRNLTKKEDYLREWPRFVRRPMGCSVFFSNRAACFLCHRVQGTGGTFGPDLSKIGNIRGRRDLLEAILYPSSTLVNGYESYAITLSDGESHSGLIHRENRDAIYLSNADQRETRIRRDQIREIRLSPLSAMPEGLAESLDPRELADLVAFLEQCQ